MPGIPLRRVSRPRAGEQVGLLVQRHPVDRDQALGVAARHVIAGNPDHPLDEHGARLVDGRPVQPGDRVEQPPERRVIDPHQRIRAWRRRRRGRSPGPRAAEHHDVAGLDRAEVVHQLVDQHLVTDQERVLHRRRRDEKRLHHERLDQQRDGQRDGQQHRQLDPERSALAPSLARAGRRVRTAGSRVRTAVRTAGSRIRTAGSRIRAAGRRIRDGRRMTVAGLVVPARPGHARIRRGLLIAHHRDRA